MAPALPPEAAGRMQQAARALMGARPADAEHILRVLAVQYPHLADIHRLLGLAVRDQGRVAEAEVALRRAHGLDPASGPAAVALAELLLALGQAEAARVVVAGLAARPNADLHILTALANAQRVLGESDAALLTYDRARRAAPGSGVAEHNLAGLLGDLERFGEAEAGARRALAKGLDAPETWLTLGRALLGQRRPGEAEAAYREAITRRPDYVDAHKELAQVVWMTTEDARAACAELDRAIIAHPNLQALRLTKAELLEYTGRAEAAYAAVADTADRPDAEPMLNVIAARLSARLDPARAKAHATRAALALPDHPVALGMLCETLLAAGDIAQAALAAEDLRRRYPLDQHALGLAVTAWRLLGDPRVEPLRDYASLVRGSLIDTPQGWPDLAAYLADLTASLMSLHTLRTHPIGQSVRHGSQTSQSLTLSEDPVIQAFFAAIDGPIRQHMASLGTGDDPVRARNTGGYRINGAWSVRLRPDGFHTDHLHPMGWLSSACHISLPGAIERGHEGWLKFGEPGIPTSPALAAEHFIKPAAGALVLFPSYMWHGTVPFTGQEPRLSIAFDLVPA